VACASTESPKLDLQKARRVDGLAAGEEDARRSKDGSTRRTCSVTRTQVETPEPGRLFLAVRRDHPGEAMSAERLSASQAGMKRPADSPAGESSMRSIRSAPRETLPASGPPAAALQKSRLTGLDALRGVAALTVVLYHYTTGYPSVTGHPLQPFFSVPDGHYGVELFFIISGFVIFMTLERTRDWRDFLSSRVARLWPGFIACLLLTAGCRWLVHPSWALPVPLVAVAANLTLMPAVFHALPADPSYWSLAYEVIFYALAGTAYYLAGVRRTEVLCLGWLTMAILARVLHRVLGGDEGEYLVETLTAVRYAPLFIIGIMIYRLRTKKSRWPAAVLLVLAVLCAQLKWSYRPISPAGFVVLVAGFACVAWVATMERSPLIRIRPLVFLGDISYPLYVIHQIVGYMIIERLRWYGLGSNASLLLTLVSVVLIAAGIHKLIEKPGQKALRRVFARRPRATLEVQPEAPRI
jgi:peptidoglycan/LPS O-acetylase OafA/YrhL